MPPIHRNFRGEQMTRLLVVDDNAALAENLKEILEAEGWTVSVCLDSLEASRDQDLSFDVALLDVRMPGMNGVELFRELSRHHPDARFFLMSGHVDDRLERRALSEGVQAVFAKPLHLSRLFRALEQSAHGLVGVERRDGTASLAKEGIASPPGSRGSAIAHR
jgi:two-component system response regulator HydG